MQSSKFFPSNNNSTLHVHLDDDKYLKQQRRSFFTYLTVLLIVLLVGSMSIFSSVLVAFFTGDAMYIQLKYKRGAVATDTQECSRIGSYFLQQGGNAIDAAVASTICLGVLRPYASGIGGGGFMLVHWKNKTTNTYDDYFIDFRERAPGASTKDMFLNQEAKSERGVLSAAIPGEVLGLYDAHQRFGKLPWKSLLKPSIDLAEQGFVADILMQARLLAAKDDIFKNDALFGEYTKVKNDEVVLMEAGDYIRRPELAESLKQIAAFGAAAMYNCTEHKLCKNIVKEVRNNGGIWTEEDMLRYRVRWFEPLRTKVDFRKFDEEDANVLEIVSGPNPSSGALINFMALLFEQKRKEIVNKKDNSEFYHLLIECLKYGFAHRMQLGDDVPRAALEKMLTLDYVKQVAANISLATTHPWSHYLTQFDTIDKQGTTHLSIVDKDLNAVSLTSSVNWAFGSKYMLSTGIVLNNHMADFTVNPNKKNGFGLPPSTANYIQPYKTPQSSMSPTFILDDKKRIKLVLGASGGPTIISTVFQVAMQLLCIHTNRSPKQAVDEPRFHVEVGKQDLLIEDGFAESMLERLRQKNHTQQVIQVLVDGHSIGNAQAVLLEEKRYGDYDLQPASDIRKLGKASGY